MSTTLTRAELDLATHLGVAGPASELQPTTIQRWQASDPEWKGKHWAYTEPDDFGARHLHPINLTTRTKTDA